MSTKHTPGTLRIWTDANGRLRVGPSSNYSVAEMFQTPLEGQEANARRIVASWNACSGISTENLEENKPIAWLAQQFNASVKQLDVLMKALRTISEESTDYEAREHALVAIAKATGEQA